MSCHRPRAGCHQSWRWRSLLRTEEETRQKPWWFQLNRASVNHPLVNPEHNIFEDFRPASGPEPFQSYICVSVYSVYRCFLYRLYIYICIYFWLEDWSLLHTLCVGTELLFHYGTTPNLTDATVWQTGPIKGDRNGIKVLKCSLSSVYIRFYHIILSYLLWNKWVCALKIPETRIFKCKKKNTFQMSTAQQNFALSAMAGQNAGISTVWWPEVQIESVYHIFDNMFQDTHKSTNNYSNLWASSKLSISMNKPTNLLHSSCPFPLKRDWINHQVCGPQQSQEPQDVGIMPKIKGHDLISVEFTPKNKTVGSHEVLLTFTLGGFKTHLFIINGEELSSLEFLIVFIGGG